MTIDVVLCADRGVIRGLATTVRSALEACSVPLNIHVLETGIGVLEQHKLERSWEHKNRGRVCFYQVTADKLARFRSTKYLKSKAAYTRYFIAMLPVSVTRCIYLDTDLLVCRDLAEASELSLEGNPIAAVPDISVRTRGVWPELRLRLGLKDERAYFNSGFMIIDLEAWRANGIEQQLVDLSIAEFDRLDSQDQDALNIVFEGRTLLLDPAWNTSQYEDPRDLEGRVVHLIGSAKPWHARYLYRPENPALNKRMYDSFYAVLDRTAYAGYRPWNPMGLGVVTEIVTANVPTADMVVGKMRRTVAKFIRPS
ncbi:MAG: glycosyltransferase family 8 protein [Allorhizobium sp.]